MWHPLARDAASAAELICPSLKRLVLTGFAVPSSYMQAAFVQRVLELTSLTHVALSTAVLATNSFAEALALVAPLPMLQSLALPADVPSKDSAAAAADHVQYLTALTALTVTGAMWLGAEQMPHPLWTQLALLTQLRALDVRAWADDLHSTQARSFVSAVQSLVELEAADVALYEPPANLHQPARAQEAICRALHGAQPVPPRVVLALRRQLQERSDALPAMPHLAAHTRLRSLALDGFPLQPASLPPTSNSASRSLELCILHSCSAASGSAESLLQHLTSVRSLTRLDISTGMLADEACGHLHGVTQLAHLALHRSFDSVLDAGELGAALCTLTGLTYLALACQLAPGQVHELAPHLKPLECMVELDLCELCEDWSADGCAYAVMHSVAAMHNLRTLRVDSGCVPLAWAVGQNLGELPTLQRIEAGFAMRELEVFSALGSVAPACKPLEGFLA
jgi:hypothetical protein